VTTLQATTDFTGTDGAAFPTAMNGAVSGALVGTRLIKSNTGEFTVGSVNGNFGGNDRASANTALANTTTDAVVRVKFRFMNTASGGVNATKDTLYPSVWVRANSTMDSASGYKVELDPFTTNYDVARVQAYGGTNSLDFGTGTFATTVGTWYWIVFGVVGTAIKFMIWQDGTPQPATWQAQYTDTFITAGSVGIQAGKADVNGAKMQWDDLTVYSTFAEALQFTGTVAGTATGSSAITGQSGRRGTVAATATASATITGAISSGSVSGTATASAVITGQSNRLGTVSGSVTASSTLTGTSGRVGTVSATATGTASLSGITGYRGTVTGTATASASISGLDAILIYGSVSGTATASAAISGSPDNLGSVIGEAIASAEIRGGVGLYFTPPSYKQHPRDRHPLIARTYIVVGVTLLKFGSSYRTYIDTDPELIAQADKTYLGGHLYFVDFSEVEELRNAGYGQWLSETYPTSGSGNYQVIDYSQYGAGIFGTGPFGA
jgi:hypothetical protein